MFTINLDGFKKYEEQFHYMKKNLPNELEDYLLDIAKSMMRMAKTRTPKDDGTLKAGWKISEITKTGDDLVIKVYNDVFYSMFVEFGHKVVVNKKTVGKAEGFYMMTIAKKNVRKQIPRRLRKTFDKVVNSL